jgi:hypothetical protein
MIIDDVLVKHYFNGENDMENHWLFYSIEEGKHLYEAPKAELRKAIEQLYQDIMVELRDFHPFNEELYDQLFPEWRSLIENVNVLLAVGCPPPYDAMVREHEKKEYIIFDLVRFHDYDDGSGNLIHYIISMITHECTHICIHEDFPVKVDASYREKLEHITFDEGIAHLLALNNSILSYDYSNMSEKHYQDSMDKLREALQETNPDKQLNYLEDANCGSYWEKFAAIAGKLYFASNRDILKELYVKGPNHLLERMGL